MVKERDEQVQGFNTTTTAVAAGESGGVGATRDLCHFVIAAVERVGMEEFQTNERGTGSEQYHPRMMLAMLIYCYANGVFGSRRIERATYRDIGARYITVDEHPDHDTICKFRRRTLRRSQRVFWRC